MSHEIGGWWVVRRMDEGRGVVKKVSKKLLGYS